MGRFNKGMEIQVENRKARECGDFRAAVDNRGTGDCPGEV